MASLPISISGILRAGLVAQISTTTTLFLLSVADRRMRGMRWLTVTAALSVVAISMRMIFPFETSMTRDLPVATVYSMCALANFLGMCHFAKSDRRVTARWPLAAALFDVLCLAAGQAQPVLASGLVRVVTLITLGITIRMLWRTSSPALRPTMRTAAFFLVVILLVPVCNVGFSLAGTGAERNWMFTRMAVVLVVTLMDFVFVAAYVAESKRRLYEGTRRDPLTGLRNRLAFEEAAARAITLASARRPLALLMIDLDSFKKLNDTWGHIVGDRALRVVGEVVQSIVGNHPGPCLARLGGEEFGVLLPDHDAAMATTFAERIRAAISALRLPEARGVVCVTASIGVGGWEPGEAEATPMMRRADAALYQAKHSGRNCVVRFEEQHPEESSDAWPVAALAVNTGSHPAT